MKISEGTRSNTGLESDQSARLALHSDGRQGVVDDLSPADEKLSFEKDIPCKRNSPLQGKRRCLKAPKRGTT